MHFGNSHLAHLLLAGLFAAAPSSTNFTLKAYDVGTGGGALSSSSYKLNGSTGTSTGSQSSATYGADSGLAPTVNSNVPPAPTLTNPSSYYDRLKLVLATGNNPSTTKFAVAISPDAFASTTRYVKSDNSLGASLVATDYRTYASWGSGTGVIVTGLLPGTTYTVKVKAMQGNFTETGYGPTVATATVQPTLTFSVATTLTGTPPFTVNFANLTPSTVVSGNADAIVTITTNALLGGRIFLKDSFGGLRSTAASYTLTSATADLTAAAYGFGAQVISTGQGAGGPMVVSSPFNGASNNVGVVTTGLQELATSSAAITTGSATVRFKAKADTVTVPAQTDYQDTLTFVAAMSF